MSIFRNVSICSKSVSYFIRLLHPYTTKSISLVGVDVPVAKEPNKSSRFTPFFLQISVTCSISSDIGIVFMYRPSSHHQEQSLSSSLVIDLSIADYFLKNNIQSLPAHRHLFHINAILSNMYDSIILRKAFFSCIMCND